MCMQIEYLSCNRIVVLVRRTVQAVLPIKGQVTGLPFRNSSFGPGILMNVMVLSLMVSTLLLVI